MRGRIIYEEVSDYIENTAAPLCNILKSIKAQADDLQVPVACTETLEFLKLIVRVKRPSNILELGTGNGLSAASMCFALNCCDDSLPCYSLDSSCFSSDPSECLLSDLCTGTGATRLVTIERNSDMAAYATNNLKKFPVRVINEDAASVLPRLISDGNKFDFIFLDCAKSSYIKFLPMIMKLMLPGSILAADNVLFKGMVTSGNDQNGRFSAIVRNLRDYIDKVMSDKNLESCILPIGDGLCVSLLR